MLINKDCPHFRGYAEIDHSLKGEKYFGFTTIVICEMRGEIPECPSGCPYPRINIKETEGGRSIFF